MWYWTLRQIRHVLNYLHFLVSATLYALILLGIFKMNWCTQCTHCTHFCCAHFSWSLHSWHKSHSLHSIIALNTSSSLSTLTLLIALTTFIVLFELNLQTTLIAFTSLIAINKLFSLTTLCSLYLRAYHTNCTHSTHFNRYTHFIYCTHYTHCTYHCLRIFETLIHYTYCTPTLLHSFLPNTFALDALSLLKCCTRTNALNVISLHLWKIRLESWIDPETCLTSGILNWCNDYIWKTSNCSFLTSKIRSLMKHAWLVRLERSKRNNFTQLQSWKTFRFCIEVAWLLF